MQYTFKNVHEQIPAAVVYCLDPRFRTQHENFITQELGFEKFDQYVFPGGPKVLADETTRDIFLGAIEKVSLGLHHVKELVLIAHRDCGAYGGSKFFVDKGGLAAEKEAQVEHLKLASNILQENLPGIAVSMYYLEIVGEDKVEFQQIK